MSGNHRPANFIRPALAAGRIFCVPLLLCGSLKAADRHEVPKPAVPDPSAEGWDSESYADAAQDRLKKWLHPLEEGSREFPAVRAEFLLLPPLGPPVQTVSVTVRRSIPGKPAPAPDLKAALAPVLAGFAPGAPLHLKVKTLGVKKPAPASGQPGQTTHLFHVDGPVASPGPGSPAPGRREINATWIATWAADNSLLSLQAVKFEEVTTAEAAPAFTDQTAAVLGAEADTARQFSGGIPHYQLRIQATVPLFKFGHQGVSIADVNGDGLDDLHICAPGGLPNRLLIHQPDGTVKDAAADYGVDILEPAQTALFADFDNDGDPDLALGLQGPLTIFENDGGRRFIPRIRLKPVSNCYGLAAADYDGDGDVDIYAARYYATEEEGGELAVPVPFFDANNGGADFLIRNDGRSAEGWRLFSDASTETGLNGPANQRFSYAVVWQDVNLDGLPDIYVANDFGKNNLYIQSRGADGKPRFEDRADAAGLAAGAFGMSASAADINRDGWPDLHLGAMWSSAGNRITDQENFRAGISDDLRGRFRRLARGNTLFRNGGQAGLSFEDVSESAGITIGRWSWASVFGDIDCDGWPDLLVANGYVTGERPDDL